MIRIEHVGDKRIMKYGRSLAKAYLVLTQIGLGFVLVPFERLPHENAS